MSTELSKGNFAATNRGAARVLVVCGDASAREWVDGLSQAGHEVAQASTPETACASLADQKPDLVMADAGMAEEVVAVCSDLGVPFCLLGNGSGTQHAESLGTFPLTIAGEAAVALVDIMLDREQIRRRVTQLESLLDGVRDGTAMVGRSPVMRRLQTTLSRAAEGDATVLIEGARGVGKSLAARLIHCKSRRGHKAICAQDASKLDAEGLQNAIAEAKGTTLLIEDIEQMPAAGQQLLVRFLKERGTRPSTDGAPARIVATTTAHLPELVSRGAFREDLYYRLHSYPIVVPSLRERTEDIMLLADSILEQTSSTSTQRPAGFTPAARTMLETMPWPGNVAQLENVVRRAIAAAAGSAIEERHLTPAAVAAPTPTGSATSTNSVKVASNDEDVDEQSIRPFEDEEKEILERALRATGGKVRPAAQLLGIGRATLYRKIQQFKLRFQ